MSEITNRSVALEDILGRETRVIVERVAECINGARHRLCNSVNSVQDAAASGSSPRVV